MTDRETASVGPAGDSCAPFPTRRRWLWVVLVAVGGGVGGYGAGVWARHSAEASESVARQQKDGSLAWARGLAQPDTPIEELCAEWQAYLHVFGTRGHDDALLWSGIRRLAELAVDGPVALAPADRRRLARALVSTLRSRRPPPGFDCSDLEPALRRVSR